MGWTSREKQREYMARYQVEHAAELKAKAAARYRRNRERILEQRAAYRAANLDKIVRRQRAYQPLRRARRHGLTDDVIEKQYELQEGRCAICRDEFPRTGHNGLVVDHDHQTDARRGLICRPCNIALPMIERLGRGWADRALDYLANPPMAALDGAR